MKLIIILQREVNDETQAATILTTIKTKLADNPEIDIKGKVTKSLSDGEE